MKKQTEIGVTRRKLTKFIAIQLADFCDKVSEARKDFDSLIKALEKINAKRELNSNSHERSDAR